MSVQSCEVAKVGRQRARHSSDADTHIIVSSPATVPSRPSTRCGRAPTPPRGAHPGGVRTMTRLPEQVTSATHSPITRRSWSSGATRSGANSGTAYTVLPPGTRTLIAPRSSRSRDTVACVASMPSSASSSTSCGWFVTSCSSISRLIVPVVGPCSSSIPDSSVHSGSCWRRMGAHAEQERHRGPGSVQPVVALLEHHALRTVDHVGGHLEARDRPAGSA